jgi:hypothetical protein
MIGHGQFTQSLYPKDSYIDRARDAAITVVEWMDGWEQTTSARSRLLERDLVRSQIRAKQGNSAFRHRRRTQPPLPMMHGGICARATFSRNHTTLDEY